MIDIVAFGMDMNIMSVREDIKSPFVFGGFLPQDITTNSSNKIRETDLVDEFGNPFVKTWLSKINSVYYDKNEE